MFLGAVLAIFLVDANKVVRDDNTKVILMKNPSWSSEVKGLWETISTQPWVLLLFPMFFSSNIFVTYQTNDMNGAHFNVRTRALNNLLYWLAQIIGALIFGSALDIAKVRRSVRAKASFAALFVLTFVIWGGGYAWQRLQVSRAVAQDPEFENSKIDWTDGGKLFIGPMFLYFFYGFYDAAWQTCIYWYVLQSFESHCRTIYSTFRRYMGALSNSGRKAANLAGKYPHPSRCSKLQLTTRQACTKVFTTPSSSGFTC